MAYGICALVGCSAHAIVTLSAPHARLAQQHAYDHMCEVVQSRRFEHAPAAAHTTMGFATPCIHACCAAASRSRWRSRSEAASAAAWCRAPRSLLCCCFACCFAVSSSGGGRRCRSSASSSCKHAVCTPETRSSTAAARLHARIAAPRRSPRRFPRARGAAFARPRRRRRPFARASASRASSPAASGAETWRRRKFSFAARVGTRDRGAEAEINQHERAGRFGDEQIPEQSDSHKHLTAVKEVLNIGKSTSTRVLTHFS